MKVFKYITAAVILVILFKACVSHDISDPEIEDASDTSLFAEATESGYTYYQSGATIPPASQSPHKMFKLRFNPIAFGALGPDGELPENSSFPTGSVIVKEVFVNSAIAVLAVIKKSPTDPNAGEGWLWAEYALDGTPHFSIEAKGNGCIGCHNETPNRDLVRTFDLH